MEINRTKILLFFVAYTLLVTTVTIYLNVYYLIVYIHNFKFGFVLTETGVSIITPLIPVSRLLLSFVGVVGVVYLYIRKRKGIWISACWAVLQIPSFTLTFEKATSKILQGLSSLNLQMFYAGYMHTSSAVYKSTFTHTTSVLTKGFGINFIGVFLLIVIANIWLQNNQRFVTYIKNTTNIYFRKIIPLFQSAIVLLIISIVGTQAYTNWINKPDLKVKVFKVTYLVDLDFISADKRIETSIVNINATIKNIGRTPTTIDRIYLKLKIFPNSIEMPNAMMPDVPTYETFYAGGSNEGYVLNAYNKKLWELAPNEYKKDGFTSLRIDSEDKVASKFSFIIPRRLIGDNNHNYQLVSGLMVVETVGGDIIEAEVPITGNFLRYRPDYPSNSVVVKDWNEITRLGGALRGLNAMPIE